MPMSKQERKEIGLLRAMSNVAGLKSKLLASRQQAMREFMPKAKTASKTLAAVRKAVADSGKTANAIAVAAELLPQTVHEMLVNGTGDGTLAKFEAILGAVGKQLIVVDVTRKK